MTRSWLSHGEEDTRTVGRELAHLLPADAEVHLLGDLGAGKTLLVKTIAAELGADPHEVSSPSFAIVHQYPLPDRPALLHIDGYRLSRNRHEWDEIGIPELLREPGLKFVEWPNEAIAAGRNDVIQIRITVNDDDSRTIELRGD